MFEGETYIIGPELLSAQGKLYIAAPEKHNKSFAMLSMAFALTSATPLWGVPEFKISRRWRVGYFDQELGSKRLQRRLKTLTVASGPDEIREFMLNIQPRDREFRFDTTEGLEKIERAIIDNDLEAAMFDPISKFYPQYDENDTRSMAVLALNQDRLIDATGCALVFAHHEAKPSMQSPRRGAQRMRGSTVLGADLDTYIGLRLLSPQHHKNQLMEASFVTRDEPIKPVYISRLESGLVTFEGWENPMEVKANTRWLGGGKYETIKA